MQQSHMCIVTMSGVVHCWFQIGHHAFEKQASRQGNQMHVGYTQKITVTIEWVG